MCCGVLCVVWCAVMWCGVVCGVGVVWGVRGGGIWCCVVWCRMIYCWVMFFCLFYDVVWCDTGNLVWRGVVRYSMVSLDSLVPPN